MEFDLDEFPPEIALAPEHGQGLRRFIIPEEIAFSCLLLEAHQEYRKKNGLDENQPLTEEQMRSANYIRILRELSEKIGEQLRIQIFFKSTPYVWKMMYSKKEKCYFLVYMMNLVYHEFPKKEWRNRFDDFFQGVFQEEKIALGRQEQETRKFICKKQRRIMYNTLCLIRMNDVWDFA